MFSKEYYISTNSSFINKKLNINIFYYTTILLVNSLIFSGLLLFFSAGTIDPVALYLYYFILLLIIFNITFTLPMAILILDSFSKNIFLKDEIIVFRITTVINYVILFLVPLLIIINNRTNIKFLIYAILLIICVFTLTIIIVLKVSLRYKFININDTTTIQGKNRVLV